MHQFSDGAAVYGIGEIDVESVQIQQFGAPQSHLFIRHEGDADFPVRGL